MMRAQSSQVGSSQVGEYARRERRERTGGDRLGRYGVGTSRGAFGDEREASRQ